MNTRDLKGIFIPLFWLFLSIYVSIASYSYDLGNWHKPGPGYFPFGAALVLGVISLWSLIKSLLKKSLEQVQVSLPKRINWQNIVLSVFALYVYVFLLNWGGFVLCTLLLMGFFLKVVSKQRWSVTLIVSCSIALGAYLLFDVLLDAQLPRGLF